MTCNHEASSRLFPAEKAARLDDPSRLDRDPPEVIVEALALEEGHHVLDFGAGTGFFTLPIARRLRALGPNGSVLAVDSQPSVLAHLEAKLDSKLDSKLDTFEGASIEPVVGSTDVVERIPAGSVHCALLANVAHEVPDRPRLFRALFHALGPGGRLVILDWEPEGSTEHGPPRDHRVAPDTLCQEILTAGFSETEPLPSYPDRFVVRGWR